LALVEAAVETLQSALAAERAGAGRIELCASLNDGGTTPSAGLIAAVIERVRIPVFVLVRPRGGDFVYSADEVDVMKRDIDVARQHGVAGIVIGALERDHRVDAATTRQLVEASAGLPVTFHRALDFTPNLFNALEHLTEIGVSRVLTSGGAPTALEGVDVIARLVDQAQDRITVMAGGGIRDHNVRDVVRQTGVREVHARVTSRMRALIELA
jgi:copper homeostasis protein